MSEWKKAIPVGYMTPEGIGQTYRCVVKPPQPRLEQLEPYEYVVQPYDGANEFLENQGICIELQDDVKLAESEILGYGDREDQILRLSLDIRSARRLCCQLVMRLAETGDHISTELEQAMMEILDRHRPENETK